MNMTEQDKQLLLKDLCARLPYEVKGRVYAETTNGQYDFNGDLIFFDSPFDVILDDINVSTEEIHVVAIGNEDTVEFIEVQQTDGEPYTINDFKPYLCPMSSMTEEEENEFKKVVCDSQNIDGISASTYVSDWLISKQFDVHGLIPKDLALEAPEDMYKF